MPGHRAPSGSSSTMWGCSAAFALCPLQPRPGVFWQAGGCLVSRTPRSRTGPLHGAGKVATSLRDTEPIASVWAVLVILTAAFHRPAGLGEYGNKELGRSSSSISSHIAANEDGAEGREGKPPSKVLCDRFATMRPARLRKRLAVLFWSEKRSIVPHPHSQKIINSKIQESHSFSAVLPGTSSQPPSLPPSRSLGHTSRAKGNILIGDPN